MKTIRNINIFAFIITLILYITVYYGLLAQIVLGVVQIILYFVILTQFQKFDNRIKSLLTAYGISTLIYLLLFFLNIRTPFINENIIVLVVFIIVIPMLIGGLHLYITCQIKNHKNENA